MRMMRSSSSQSLSIKKIKNYQTYSTQEAAACPSRIPARSVSTRARTYRRVRIMWD